MQRSSRRIHVLGDASAAAKKRAKVALNPADFSALCHFQPRLVEMLTDKELFKGRHGVSQWRELCDFWAGESPLVRPASSFLPADLPQDAPVNAMLIPNGAVIILFGRISSFSSTRDTVIGGELTVSVENASMALQGFYIGVVAHGDHDSVRIRFEDPTGVVIADREPMGLLETEYVDLPSEILKNLFFLTEAGVERFVSI